MAGLRGNQAAWMFQKNGESGKKGKTATLAEKSAYRVPYSGGSIATNRVFGKLAETDATRYQGKTYAKTGGMAGTPETYVRDESFAGIAAYTMGKNTDAGAVGKYTHTAIPFETIPYLTVWNSISGTLFERYDDCFFNSFDVKTTAGEPLSVAVNLMGAKTTRETTDPNIAGKVEQANQYVYNFNDAEVELGSTLAVTHAVSSFNLTYSNGVTVQQTDDFSPYDLVTGIITVDLSYDIIFENLEEYNLFNYGSTSGTAESNKINETKATFKFKDPNSAANYIEFVLPNIAYETYPINPNTTGAPLVASVKAVAQRPGVGVNILTVKTENQQKEVGA